LVEKNIKEQPLTPKGEQEILALIYRSDKKVNNLTKPIQTSNPL